MRIFLTSIARGAEEGRGGDRLGGVGIMQLGPVFKVSQVHQTGLNFQTTCSSLSLSYSLYIPEEVKCLTGIVPLCELDR